MRHEMSMLDLYLYGIDMESIVAVTIYLKTKCLNYLISRKNYENMRFIAKIK